MVLTTLPSNSPAQIRKVRRVLNGAAKFPRPLAKQCTSNRAWLAEKSDPVLLRFRKHPYSVSADIEAMFRSFLGPEDIAKQNTYKRSLYLCRPKIPRSEVRIPLNSEYFLFYNISNNFENVLLSFQMYCSLILMNTFLFFFASWLILLCRIKTLFMGRTELKYRLKQISFRNRFFLKGAVETRINYSLTVTKLVRTSSAYSPN